MAKQNEIAFLDNELDTMVVALKIEHSRNGVQFFHLEKRWRSGYLPRYIVGGGSEEPKEFKHLPEALAELVIQISDVQARANDENLWWTKGEGKAERDAVIRDMFRDDEVENAENL